MTSLLLARASKSIRVYFGAPSKEVELKSPSTMQMGILCLLLVVALLLSLKNYDSFQLGTYMDDASYAVLAQSIAFSDSYGLMNTPGQPLPTRYPFGFPLLLSPLARIFPEQPGMMKVVSLAFTLVNAVLLFGGWPMLSQSKSYWWGLAIAALYCLSPLVIGHTRMVMSEPAFTASVLLALIMCEKHVASERVRPLAVVLTGIVAVFAVFIRTIGISLVVAIVARILMLRIGQSSRMKRLLLLVFGGIVFTLIVVVTTPVAVSDLMPHEYANQFDSPQEWGQSDIENALVPRMFSGFLAYTGQHLRATIIPIGGGSTESEFGKRLGVPDLPLLTGLAIGSLVLLGHLSLLQERGMEPSVSLFEMLYLATVLAWPWRGARFLYPIQPLLLYYVLCGSRLVAGEVRHFRFTSPRLRRVFVDSSVVLPAILMLAISLYKGVTDTGHSTQYVRDFGVGATWLKENSPSDAIVMAEQPQSIYLYSQRKTIDYTVGLREAIDLNVMDYILVAPKLEWRQDGSLVYSTNTREAFLPLLNELASKGTLELVYQSSKDMVQVYQVQSR